MKVLKTQINKRKGLKIYLLDVLADTLKKEGMCFYCLFITVVTCMPNLKAVNHLHLPK